MAFSTQFNEKLVDIPIQANADKSSTVSIPLKTGEILSASSAGNALFQRTQSTATENTDASSYKKRSPSTLSATETRHLEDMERDQCLQHLKGLSTVFAGPLVQQRIWPLYFETKEAAGKAMQNGYKDLWSTFIIAETLLAAVAIQPFITNVPTLSGWQLKAYGGLWASALLLDFIGLAITTIFLAYLLGKPSNLTWVWVCNIGPLIGIPVILLVLDTIWSIIAISFSSWVIYGTLVGTICAVVAVLAVAAGVTISNLLGPASRED